MRKRNIRKAAAALTALALCAGVLSGCGGAASSTASSAASSSAAASSEASGEDADDFMARLKAHEAEFFDWLEEFIQAREVALYA